MEDLSQEQCHYFATSVFERGKPTKIEKFLQLWTLDRPLFHRILEGYQLDTMLIHYTFQTPIEYLDYIKFLPDQNNSQRIEQWLQRNLTVLAEFNNLEYDSDQYHQYIISKIGPSLRGPIYDVTKHYLLKMRDHPAMKSVYQWLNCRYITLNVHARDTNFFHENFDHLQLELLNQGWVTPRGEKLIFEKMDTAVINLNKENNYILRYRMLKLFCQSPVEDLMKNRHLKDNLIYIVNSDNCCCIEALIDELQKRRYNFECPDTTMKSLWKKSNNILAIKALMILNNDYIPDDIPSILSKFTRRKQYRRLMMVFANYPALHSHPRVGKYLASFSLICLREEYDILNIDYPNDSLLTEITSMIKQYIERYWNQTKKERKACRDRLTQYKKKK